MPHKVRFLEKTIKAKDIIYFYLLGLNETNLEFWYVLRLLEIIRHWNGFIDRGEETTLLNWSQTHTE